MKRWLGRIVAAAVLFALAVTAVSIRAVDWTSPDRAHYSRRTTEALQQAFRTSARCGTQLLEAGVGRAGLTPKAGVPLAGYGDRKGQGAEGVHDSLFVHALVVRGGQCVVAFVALEALIVPSEVALRVLDSLHLDPGLGASEVYFGATHTHSGPGGWGRGPLAEAFAGEFRSEVVDMLVDSSVAAVRRAWSDLGPAEATWGQFAARRFTANRLVGEKGTVDSLFSFLAFRRGGWLLAVLGSFAAHATVLPASNLQFSGDWPGFWSRALELAGVRCTLYVAGGVGSHAPRSPGKDFQGAQALGGALADSVLARLRAANWRREAVLQALWVPVELGPMQLRISQKLRLASWLTRRITNPGPVWLNGVRIGDLVLLSAPADWSGELTNELRATADSLGWQVTVTSFNGGYIGYVVPDRYYPLRTYETRLMSFYGPHTASYFMGLYRKMLYGLAANRQGQGEG